MQEGKIRMMESYMDTKISNKTQSPPSNRYFGGVGRSLTYDRTIMSPYISFYAGSHKVILTKYNKYLNSNFYLYKVVFNYTKFLVTMKT